MKVITLPVANTPDEAVTFLKELGYAACDVNIDRVLSGEEPYSDEDLADLQYEADVQREDDRQDME